MPGSVLAVLRFSRFRWGTEGLESQAVGAGAPQMHESGVVFGGRGGRNCGAMLSWLQDVLWPSKAPKSDYDDLVFEILFEDLDRNGDGVVDITELRDGLEHWNSYFGKDPEKVSH